jgi:hypothetical protein
MLPSLHTVLKQAEQPFNIIEEFAVLDVRQKILLCDHLFIEGYHSFERTVKLLWTRTSERDVKKLEAFLRLLKKTAH